MSALTHFNAVGALYEWMQKLPSHRTIDHTFTGAGADHMPVFTCTTTVTASGNSTEHVAIGPNKKDAKQKSALEACLALGLI
ncbi:hypothetical protein JCM11641_005632 [Rhodosporidiobolus odoratus]